VIPRLRDIDDLAAGLAQDDFQLVVLILCSRRVWHLTDVVHVRVVPAKILLPGGAHQDSCQPVSLIFEHGIVSGV
jgi:hypothetical protein